jgi:hypothetical protein
MDLLILLQFLLKRVKLHFFSDFSIKNNSDFSNALVRLARFQLEPHKKIEESES